MKLCHWGCSFCFVSWDWSLRSHSHMAKCFQSLINHSHEFKEQDVRLSLQQFIFHSKITKTWLFIQEWDTSRLVWHVLYNPRTIWNPWAEFLNICSSFLSLKYLQMPTCLGKQASDPQDQDQDQRQWFPTVWCITMFSDALKCEKPRNISFFSTYFIYTNDFLISIRDIYVLLCLKHPSVWESHWHHDVTPLSDSLHCCPG